MQNRMAERFILSTEPAFRSIRDVCWKLNNNFRDNENYYVHFHSNPNTAAFPWMSDYNELIVKGFHDFGNFYFQYNLTSDDAIRKGPRFWTQISNVSIRWNVTSLEATEFKYYPLTLRMSGYFNEAMDDLKLEVATFRLGRVLTEYLPIPTEIAKMTEKLLENGIKETLSQSKYLTLIVLFLFFFHPHLSKRPSAAREKPQPILFSLLLQFCAKVS